jgi:hypothetical protein
MASGDQSTGRLRDFAEWRRAQNFHVPAPGPRPADTAPFDVRRAWAMDHYLHRMAEAQTPDAYDEAQRGWLEVAFAKDPA